MLPPKTEPYELLRVRSITSAVQYVHQELGAVNAASHSVTENKSVIKPVGLFCAYVQKTTDAKHTSNHSRLLILNPVLLSSQSSGNFQGSL